MVPIASNRLSRKATIGISTSSAVFASLIFVIILYFILRWRKHRAVAASQDTGVLALVSSEVRSFSTISIQEAGQQIVQELHATSHLIELLDGQAPSGSGMGMNELSEWRESFSLALLQPAMQDRSIAPSRESKIPSVKMGNNKDGLFRSSIDRTSNLSISFLNTRSLTEKDDVGSRITIGKVVKNSSCFKTQGNVTKALS